jgi:hypothetical protein
VDVVDVLNVVERLILKLLNQIQRIPKKEIKNKNILILKKVRNQL